MELWNGSFNKNRSPGHRIRGWKMAPCFRPDWCVSAWTLGDSVCVNWLKSSEIQVGSAPEFCYSRDPGVPGVAARQMTTCCFLIRCSQWRTFSAGSCSQWRGLIRDFSSCSPIEWAFLTALASWIQNFHDILSCFPSCHDVLGSFQQTGLSS